MRQRGVEIFVGLFVIMAAVALLILALRVSGLTDLDTASGYEIHAEFDNIGGLKMGAPVTIAGVKVGEIDSIKLDPETFRAEVSMEIYNGTTKIPVDSSASILTAGILGAQYMGITPGFEDKNLTNQQSIKTTHSALILENLIGQLLFHLKGD